MCSTQSLPVSSLEGGAAKVNSPAGALPLCGIFPVRGSSSSHSQAGTLSFTADLSGIVTADENTEAFAGILSFTAALSGMVTADENTGAAAGISSFTADSAG